MAESDRIEPLLWLLFSAGGVVAALLLPVAAVFLFGAGVPARLALAAQLRAPARRAAPSRSPALALFVLCVLSLFHWAHRFRYTLYDGLQIKHLNEMINAVCYGGAIVGSLVAAYLLLTL